MHRWMLSTIQVGFNGTWSKGSINGNSLTRANGAVGKLRTINARMVEMTTHEGYICTGELLEDGKLHWADGDIWTRPTQNSNALASESQNRATFGAHSMQVRTIYEDDPPHH